MASKNMIGGIVSLAVVVICVAAIMMPVLSEATKTTETFTNEGYARYTSIESSDADALTITWDHTDPAVFTVGTEEVDCSQMTSYTSVLLGDDWAVRFITNGTSYGGIQYLGPSASDFLQVTANGTADLTITLNAGTATITDGTSTKTTDYTEVYYPDNDGEMTMKKSDSSAYLLSDSSIVVANGATALTTSASVGITFSGTVEDGYDFTFYRNNNNCTATNVVSHYTEMDDYVNLVELSKITFDIDSDLDTVSATYSYFLVPYEVTADLAHSLNDGERAILNAIPAMIVVAIIIAALGVFVTAKRD